MRIFNLLAITVAAGTWSVSASAHDQFMVHVHPSDAGTIVLIGGIAMACILAYRYLRARKAR